MRALQALGAEAQITSKTCQTFYLTQLQHTDTGPTSPSADPMMPGAWQGSHWSAIFLSHWYDSTRKNPSESGIRTPDLPPPRRTPLPLGQRGGLLDGNKLTSVLSHVEFMFILSPPCPMHTDQPRITVQSAITSTQPLSTTLQCDVDAFPAITALSWYKGGQLLDTSDSSRYSGATIGFPSLTIASVSAQDAGSYYCVVSNSVGTSISGTIVLTVNCKSSSSVFV